MNAYEELEKLGYKQALNTYEELNLTNGTSVIAIYKKDNNEGFQVQKYREDTLELENITDEEEYAIKMLISVNMLYKTPYVTGYDLWLSVADTEFKFDYDTVFGGSNDSEV